MTEPVFFPHDCERSFPVCEEREELLAVSSQMQTIKTYKDNDGSIGVIEFYTPKTSGKGRFLQRQRLLYVTNGEVNWKMFTQKGKLEAAGVRRYTSNGDIEDGLYKTSYADGAISEAQTIGNIPQGERVLTYPDGTIETCFLVNGQPQGERVLTYTDGSISRCLLINGHRHGEEITTYPDGEIARTLFVNGEARELNVTHPSGLTGKHPLINGEVQGEVVFTRPDNETVKIYAVDGRGQGLARCYDPSGSLYRYDVYVDNQVLTSFKPSADVISRQQQIAITDITVQQLPSRDFLLREAICEMTLNRVDYRTISNVARKMAISA